MLEVFLKKTMGSFSLSVVLKANKGIVGVLGPSGSGKSLTLRCIAGLIKPDEGEIVVDGNPVFDSCKKK